MTVTMWKWRYLENPASLEEPLIYVTESKGEIVGARPLIPCRIRFGDRILKAAQPCDPMVHPDHRKKGVFTRMNDFSIIDARKKGFSLFYSFPNPSVRKIYQKSKSLGWTVIAKTDPSYWIFCPKNVISTALPNGFPSSIGKIAFRLFYRKKSKLPSLITAKSYDTNVEHAMTNEIGDLSKDTHNTCKLNTMRDESYMRWRFMKHPENNYRFLCARKGKELLGYFVFRTVTYGKVVEAQIVDYAAKADCVDVYLSLMSEALNIFQREGCDLMSIWAFTQPEFQRELDRCGFIRRSSLPYKPSKGDYYFSVNKAMSTDLPVDPMDQEHWHITQSDRLVPY